MILSKELLSEVLEFDIDRLDFVRMSEDAKEVEFGFILDEGMNIQNVFHMNIYELAHKCKKWAFKQNFLLASFKRWELENYGCEIYQRYCNVCEECGEESFVNWEQAETEPEAIFKACEWILDTQEKK